MLSLLWVGALCLLAPIGTLAVTINSVSLTQSGVCVSIDDNFPTNGNNFITIPGNTLFISGSDFVAGSTSVVISPGSATEQQRWATCQSTQSFSTLQVNVISSTLLVITASITNVVPGLPIYATVTVSGDGTAGPTAVYCPGFDEDEGSLYPTVSFDLESTEDQFAIDYNTLYNYIYNSESEYGIPLPNLAGYSCGNSGVSITADYALVGPNGDIFDYYGSLPCNFNGFSLRGDYYTNFYFGLGLENLTFNIACYTSYLSNDPSEGVRYQNSADAIRFPFGLAFALTNINAPWLDPAYNFYGTQEPILTGTFVYFNQQAQFVDYYPPGDIHVGEFIPTPKVQLSHGAGAGLIYGLVLDFQNLPRCNPNTYSSNFHDGVMHFYHSPSLGWTYSNYEKSDFFPSWANNAVVGYNFDCFSGILAFSEGQNEQTSVASSYVNSKWRKPLERSGGPLNNFFGVCDSSLFGYNYNMYEYFGAGETNLLQYFEEGTESLTLRPNLFSMVPDISGSLVVPERIVYLSDEYPVTQWTINVYDVVTPHPKIVSELVNTGFRYIIPRAPTVPVIAWDLYQCEEGTSIYNCNRPFQSNQGYSSPLQSTGNQQSYSSSYDGSLVYNGSWYNYYTVNVHAVFDSGNLGTPFTLKVKYNNENLVNYFAPSVSAVRWVDRVSGTPVIWGNGEQNAGFAGYFGEPYNYSDYYTGNAFPSLVHSNYRFWTDPDGASVTVEGSPICLRSEIQDSEGDIIRNGALFGGVSETSPFQAATVLDFSLYIFDQSEGSSFLGQPNGYKELMATIGVGVGADGEFVVGENPGIKESVQTGCVNCCGDGVLAADEVCDTRAQWLFAPSCLRPDSNNVGGCQFASVGTPCYFDNNELGEECGEGCINSVVTVDPLEEFGMTYNSKTVRICDRYCGNDILDQCNPYYYNDNSCMDEEMDCGQCLTLAAGPNDPRCGQCYYRGYVAQSTDEDWQTVLGQQEQQMAYLQDDTQYGGTGCTFPPSGSLFDYPVPLRRGISCRAIDSEAYGTLSPYPCRASGGFCDFQETCSGDSPMCPEDNIKPSGSLCMSCEVTYYNNEARRTNWTECDPLNGNGVDAYSLGRMNVYNLNVPNSENCGSQAHPCRCGECDGVQRTCTAQMQQIIPGYPNDESAGRATDSGYWAKFTDHWCRSVSFINDDTDSRAHWFSKCVDDVNITLEYYINNGLKANGVDDFDTNDSDGTLQSATEFCHNYFYGASGVLTASMFALLLSSTILVSLW